MDKFLSQKAVSSYAVIAFVLVASVAFLTGHSPDEIKEFGVGLGAGVGGLSVWGEVRNRALKGLGLTPGQIKAKSQ